MFARALYSEADVYFLDDILSAVDMPTGQRLWHTLCKLRTAGRTVVLATHQLQLLHRQEVDRVIYLHAGSVVCTDTPRGVQKALARSELPGLATLLAQAHQLAAAVEVQPHNACGGEAASPRAGEEQATPPVASEAQLHKSHEDGEKEESPPSPVVMAAAAADGVDLITLHSALRRFTTALRQVSGWTVDAHLIGRLRRQLVGQSADGTDGKSAGTIAPAVYGWYTREYGSVTLWVMLVLVAFLAAAFEIADRVWLSMWTEGNTSCQVVGDTPDIHGSASASSASSAMVSPPGPCNAARQRLSLLVFMGLGTISAVLAASTTVLNRVVCATRASRSIHQQVLASLMRATTEFFDTTATGQIINRLLTDIKILDWEVAQVVSELMCKLFAIVTNIVVIVVFAPFLVPVALGLLPFYIRIFSRARVANRDCRRIQSSAHSPVYSNFSDVVSGRETVAAYGAEARFVYRNDRLIGAMCRAQLGSNSVIQWASIRYMLLGVVLYAALGFSCVGLVHSGRMSLSSLGFVLVQGEQMVRLGMDAINLIAKVEIDFVAAERLLEYTRLEPEPDFDSESGPSLDLPRLPPPPSPSHAEEPPPNKLGDDRGDATITQSSLGLEITNAWFRYQLHRPYVLRGLALSIPVGASPICPLRCHLDWNSFTKRVHISARI
jgi:ATP-binding cassette subfamily C (CFTR/MRP) protein 1